MIKKFIKYTVSAAVLASMFQAAPAFADTPVTQEQINNTQVQIDNFETKIQQLDDRISTSMEKSRELSGQIKTQEGKIKDTEAEIKESKDSLEAHKEVYAERLKSLQSEGKDSVVTYAGLLLTSEDLSQFLTRFTAISTIIQGDNDLLNGLKEKEQALRDAEGKLHSELEKLQKDQTELASVQKAIEADKKEITTELASAKNNLQKLEVKMAEQKEAEERARIAAEQRALEQRQENNETSQDQEQPRAEQPRTAVQHTETTQSNRQESSTKKESKPSAPAVHVPTSGSASAGQVISVAKQYLGVPYVWGGTTPRGFDCSGFVQYVYRSVGVSLPRVSRDQQRVGTSVPLSQVQPGDLVFRGTPAYHVGIYIGGGKYIHAPQTGDVVKIANFNPSKFSNARRVN